MKSHHKATIRPTGAPAPIDVIAVRARIREMDFDTFATGLDKLLGGDSLSKVRAALGLRSINKGTSKCSYYDALSRSSW
jgi:hypothetical protein